MPMRRMRGLITFEPVAARRRVAQCRASWSAALLVHLIFSGAAGNRTRRRNWADQREYRITVRETTRNHAKRPAATGKALMPSTGRGHSNIAHRLHPAARDLRVTKEPLRRGLNRPGSAGASGISRAIQPTICTGADFPLRVWDPRSVSPSGRESQGVNGLLSEKDLVAGGFGELLDAGGHVDGVADKVNASLPPPPMVPAITTPVLIPMPMRSAPPNRSATRR
jgi:hypothetical protein